MAAFLARRLEAAAALVASVLHGAAMPTREPPLPRIEARVLFVAGLCAWLLSAAAALWEGLALQSPVSPLHVGLLAGPIGQLQRTAFAFGAAGLVLGLAWERVFAHGEGRAALGLLFVGSGAQLAALGYAALYGLLAVQLNDPRGDARACLWLRAAGHTLVSVGLVLVLRRALRRSPAPSPEPG